MASDCRWAADQENPGRRSSDGISPSVGRIGERHKTVCPCRHDRVCFRRRLGKWKMRTRLRFAVAIASAMLTTGYARSASNQDEYPGSAAEPIQNRSSGAEPHPMTDGSRPPNPSKDRALRRRRTHPKPPLRRRAHPETAAPASNDHTTAAGFWQETDDQGRAGAWFLFVEKDGLYEGGSSRGSNSRENNS